MKQTIIRSLFLSICFFLHSFSSTAIEIIRFTWSVVGVQEFKFHATEGKEYTIDWGDESAVETKVGVFGWSFPSHTYTTLNNYQVIITGSEGCLFGYLDCANKNVSSLDLSKNLSLSVLFCDNNQLTHLDLSNNPYLMQVACGNNHITNLELTTSYSGEIFLDCSNNGLLLSKLYTICQKIDEPKNRIFGTQNLNAENTVIFDFSSETEFYGILTVFDVQKDNFPAILDVDYEITNGIISFKKSGNYLVTMTNEAIGSSTEVIAEFNINIDGIFHVMKSSNLIVYPNPNTGRVYIKTESDIMPEVLLYNTNGNLLQSFNCFEIDMSNYPKGNYMLKVKYPKGNIYTTKIVKM